jgi:hypothetical protein
MVHSSDGEPLGSVDRFQQSAAAAGDSSGAEAVVVATGRGASPKKVHG